MAFTRNNKPKYNEHKYAQENVVERAGYITTQKRAENIINAGKNLEAWRKQVYTNEHEREEPEINRAARKDYSFAEFHEDAKELNRRIKEKFSQQKMAEEQTKKEQLTKYAEIAKQFGFTSGDELMNSILQGNLKVSLVKNKLKGAENGTDSE